MPADLIAAQPTAENTHRPEGAIGPECHVTPAETPVPPPKGAPSSFKMDDCACL
ncbi:MAG: hypothetical protein AAFR26_17865 [Cyanobacteria bacterium J06626_4]